MAGSRGASERRLGDPDPARFCGRAWEPLMSAERAKGPLRWSVSVSECAPACSSECAQSRASVLGRRGARVGGGAQAARWPQGHRQILEVMGFRWDHDLRRLPTCQSGFLVVFEPRPQCLDVDICHTRSPETVECCLWSWLGEGSVHGLDLSGQVNLRGSVHHGFLFSS